MACYGWKLRGSFDVPGQSGTKCQQHLQSHTASGTNVAANTGITFCYQGPQCLPPHASHSPAEHCAAVVASHQSTQAPPLAHCLADLVLRGTQAACVNVQAWR